MSVMKEVIIDTHIHIWNLELVDYPWLKNNNTLLNKTYELDELESERLAAGVVAGVLVQASNNYQDTQYMLQAAAHHKWIKGVVGWLPLTEPDKVETLLQNEYKNEKYIKGIRHLIHDEPDPQWLLQPAVIESLKILASYNIPYDLVGVLPEHIETAIAVARQVPDLTIVLDHLNQPPIATKEKFGRWGELIQKAAENPKFHAKISGLGTTSANGTAWDEVTVLPYINYALKLFGAKRCFCGGDWPVSLLAGSYITTWKKYETILAALLNRDEVGDVLCNNAVSFYNLEI